MIIKKNWQNAILVAFATILFTLAYHQAPLFSSNQYQYFLHGFADAGTGILAEDWLANTVDPTPVFSWLVTITEILHARGLFYFYFFLLTGVYLFSLISIVNQLFPVTRNLQTFTIFFAGMILLHSAGLRWVLVQVPGADWSYLFDGGVAGQRLLGQVLQPSVFGVFLLLSFSLYLKKKSIPACVAAVIACLVHPTYLMSSAVLILAYMVDLWFLEKQRLRAIQLGVLALVLVSPIAIYSLVNFAGSSAEVSERAREILIDIRIPHHTKVQEWFDASTIFKLGLICVSLVFIKSKNFRFTLILPLGICLILTITQYISRISILALLFPWRISTWLVPIATAILMGAIAVNFQPASKIAHRVIISTAIGIITLATSSGLLQTRDDWDQIRQSPSYELESFVAEHRKSGEKYLIPVKMFDFRLNAGVPVYGDFYSIPYTDQEVIEWYSQFLNAKHFYETGDCSLLLELQWQGVTHVVNPADSLNPCQDIMRPIYMDDHFILLEFY